MVVKVVVEGYPLCTCITCVYVRLLHMCRCECILLNGGEGGGGGLPIMYTCTTCVCQTLF